jgi:hypothetical protein
MDLVHDDDKEHAMAAWDAAKLQSAASGNKAVPITVTFRCCRKHGSHIWVESHACITPTHAYCCFRCARCCMVR